MIVDLSHPLRNEMFALSIFPPVKIWRDTTIEEQGYNLTRLAFTAHTGTHIDAPLHFVPNGQSIDEISLEELRGRAVAWHVRGEAGQPIERADLEDQLPKVTGHKFVFIYTGWEQHFWTDRQQYGFHPYLSNEAAEWLVELGIKLVGFDTATPDLPEPLRRPGFNWPVHHIILGQGVLIAEQVANLGQLVGTEFQVQVTPLPLFGSDGAPARIIAEFTPPSAS